jgi:hypothetical protein
MSLVAEFGKRLPWPRLMSERSSVLPIRVVRRFSIGGTSIETRPTM